MNPIQKLIGEAEDLWPDYDSGQDAVEPPETESHVREMIIRRQKLSPGQMRKVLNDPDLCCDYAQWIVEGRWKEGEATIATDASASLRYARFMLKPGDIVTGSKRFPAGEPAIAADPRYSHDYACLILRGPWRDKVEDRELARQAEEALARDTFRSKDYAGVFGFTGPTQLTLGKKKYLELGSYSHGTLRTEDLLQTCLDALSTVSPNAVDHLRDDEDNQDIFKWLDGELEDEPEYVHDFISSLEDKLSTYCPPYTYWGSHPGDGSDIGVWVSEEGIEDAVIEEDAVEVDGEPDFESLRASTSAQFAVNDAHTTLWNILNGKIVWDVS